MKKQAIGTFLVFCILAVCFTPYLCTIVVIETQGLTTARRISFELTATLIFINSSLNPLIYCWRLREINVAVRRTWDGFFSWCQIIFSPFWSTNPWFTGKTRKIKARPRKNCPHVFQSYINSDQAPKRIKEFIGHSKSNYDLKGNDILKLSKINTTSFGLKSWKLPAPKLWNLKPVSHRTIRSFKVLKILFRKLDLQGLIWSLHFSLCIVNYCSLILW